MQQQLFTSKKLEIMKAIKEAIENMTEGQLIELNNRYCQEFGYQDNEIYENDEEFFNMFFEGKPMEVARATFYGDYNFGHDYVIFNGYGNLETFNTMTVDRLVDSMETMAEQIDERFEEFSDLFNID
jgi:anaerobic ribonucleoside-triphosphate reductase